MTHCICFILLESGIHFLNTKGGVNFSPFLFFSSRKASAQAEHSKWDFKVLNYFVKVNPY